MGKVKIPRPSSSLNFQVIFWKGQLLPFQPTPGISARIGGGLNRVCQVRDEGVSVTERSEVFALRGRETTQRAEEITAILFQPAWAN